MVNIMREKISVNLLKESNSLRIFQNCVLFALQLAALGLASTYLWSNLSFANTSKLKHMICEEAADLYDLWGQTNDQRCVQSLRTFRVARHSEKPTFKVISANLKLFTNDSNTPRDSMQTVKIHANCTVVANKKLIPIFVDCKTLTDNR